MSFKTILMGAAIAAALAGPALALVNSDFETGDLSGWTTNGGAAGAATGYHAFAPISGSYLGYVQAGLGKDVYTKLDQTFNLAAGQTVSGYVGFQANDYTPYNDDAYLSINGVNLFTDNVATVGNYGNSGWVPFSYTALTTGAYTLELGVANRLDNAVPSGAVLDGVSVPEPASWALMLVGFAGLGVALRGSRRTLVA